MIVDKVEIIGEWKHIQVRFIKEDGSYHRTTILCGDFDTATEYNLLDLATETWTDQVISSYENYKQINNI